MLKPKRGDFYRIKILDSLVKYELTKVEGINDDELILGATYSAILENHVEGSYYDFVILGEKAPIVQVRITESDLVHEAVWIRPVATRHQRFLTIIHKLEEELDALCWSRDHSQGTDPVILKDIEEITDVINILKGASGNHEET